MNTDPSFVLSLKVIFFWGMGNVIGNSRSGYGYLTALLTSQKS